MAIPTRGSATNETQLQVNYLALTGDSTGGATIDSYNLQYDNNTNGATWYDLIGQDGAYATALTFTVTTYV